MPDYYPHYFIQNCKDDYNEYLISTKLYGFKSTKSRIRYLVRVEEYQRKIYVVKFYPKYAKLSPDKYKILTNTNEPRRIIYTCINILKDVFNEEPHSSFAFVASSSQGESYNNTKRYRVYKTIVNTQFGTETFDHFYYEEKSTYLLLRKTELNKNPDLLQSIEEEFEKIYIFSE